MVRTDRIEIISELMLDLFLSKLKKDLLQAFECRKFRLRNKLNNSDLRSDPLSPLVRHRLRSQFLRILYLGGLNPISPQL